MYIYIYIEREREMCICMYIYIYIYIYVGQMTRQRETYIQRNHGRNQQSACHVNNCFCLFERCSYDLGLNQWFTNS